MYFFGNLMMINIIYIFTQVFYGSEVRALDPMSTQTAKVLLDLLAWYMPAPCQKKHAGDGIQEVCGLQ